MSGTMRVYVERDDGKLAKLDANFGSYEDYWEGTKDLFPRTYDYIYSDKLIVSESELDYAEKFAPDQDSELEDWLECVTVTVRIGDKIVAETEVSALRDEDVDQEVEIMIRDEIIANAYCKDMTAAEVWVSGEKHPRWTWAEDVDEDYWTYYAVYDEAGNVDTWDGADSDCWLFSTREEAESWLEYADNTDEYVRTHHVGEFVRKGVDNHVVPEEWSA